jgi:integrase
VDELGLLALVCQCTANPEWLGTVLHTMSTSRARKLLVDWATCLPELEPLSTLAYEVSATSSPAIPAALPASVPPERQLRGSLSTAFLIASLIDPAPPARDSRHTSAFPEWFETLRLWLLGQAWIRGLRGNYLDQNLRAVTDAVRHAAGRDLGWLRLLSTLYEPFSTDFESASNALRRKAQARLLASDEELSGAERRVLHALIRLARNEDAPIEAASPEGDEFHVQVPTRFSRRDGASPTHALPGLEESDSDLVIDLGESPDVDAQRVAYFLGKAAETPAQRSITGKTILLRSNEFGQYLPWSWHQLTPQERTAIDAWLESQREGFGQDALIAALTWIALVTGYSLTRVCNFGIGGDAHGDWQLSTELDALFRTPPRPSYMRELPNAVAQMLAPPASVHTIRLPEWIRAALAGATPISAPQKLADFWSSCTETPSQAFSRIATAQGFARVTTSMLGHVLGYSLYHRTSDSLFALAGSAHARTAMPGAGAYPSWGAREVLDYYRGLDESQLEISPEGDSVNALGSRLRVVEKSFSSALNKVFSALESQMLQGSPIDQHNAYTTALVLKLLAATGSRPVGDPFESPLHFDLEHHRVFVADKLVVGAEGGRLVPIPKSLSVEVERYFSYLAKLATLLQPAEPALSGGLRGLHELNAPFLLPLFFYLQRDGWESISEDGLRRHLAGEFSAPLNIFRHRLPVLLRAKGVDPEVIDGLLGHGYGGCATYGDWSTRQWNVDMEQAVPALEKAFEDLGLPILKVPMLRTTQELHITQALQLAPFGVARRKLEQRKRREAARQQARALIEDWLGDRKIGEVTAQDLADIERMVVTTPSGMPHVMAHIRYAVLQRYFNMQLRRGATTLRLRRSYIELNEDPPFTNELAGRAPSVVSKLLDLLPILRKEFPPSRATAADAWLMACLHLMLEGRISNYALLKEISNPRAIRVVHFQRRYWLEFRANAANTADESEDNDGASPCLRFPISRDSAAFLEASRKPGRNKGHVQKKLADALISNHVDLSKLGEKKAVEKLANFIDQSNRLCLPGLLAGVLSGRVSSCSLDHYDWVRLETGTFLELPVSGDDHTAGDQLSLSPEDSPGVPDEARVVARQIEARLYFSELRQAIDGVDADPRSKSRRKMVSDVSSVVSKFRSRVSSALYLIGEWLYHLIGKVRSLRSIRRYLTGISPAAERVWYDADLLSADEEDVSELYSALLDARPDIELRTVGLYLRRFHAFARKYASISDPDWGELSLGQASLSVRPAYIRECDYLNAIESILLSSERHSQELVTASAMVLLLAYRYGLRASEAAGLIRADWVGDTRPLILVRNNVLRKLKTKAGRRLVPTLFELTPIEVTVIKRLLVTAEANHGGDMAVPLLGNQVRVPATIGRIRTIVIQALRWATGNPTTVIHSARHSFATRVLDSMFCADGDLQRSHLEVPNVETMRDRVLGSASQSRRTLWGLARLLGHASPTTSIGSYSHIVDRWLEDYADHNVTRRTRGAVVEGVLDLDAQPRRTALPEPCSVVDQAPSVSVGALIRLARLIGRGANLHRSAIALAIPAELSDEMAVALDSIFRVSAKRQERNKPLPELMASITESQWENLFELADEVTVPRDICWIKVPTAPDFAGLVGPQRHIVMWREEHFEWIGQLVKSLNLQKADIRILITFGFTGEQQNWIERHGLSRFVSTDVSETQLDTVKTENQRAVVVERAVLIASRRKQHPLGNRILLAVLAIAWHGTVSLAQRDHPPRGFGK